MSEQQVIRVHDRTIRREAFYVFIIFASFYLLTTGGHFYSVDHHIMYQTTESIVEDRDLSLPLDSIDVGIMGSDGQSYSRWGLGQPILSVPFYLVGKYFHSLFLQNLEQEYVTIFTVSTFTVFVTAFTCAVVYLFGLRLGYTPKVSLLITVIFGVATPAWPYSKYFFTEPLSGLGILCSFYFINTAKDNPRHMFLSGLFIGLAVLARIASVIVVPVLILYILLIFRGRSTFSEQLRLSAMFSLPLFLALVGVVGMNYLRFGSFFSTGYEDVGFTTPLLVGLTGLLLSPGKSIFIYMPVSFLFFVSIKDFYRQHRSEALIFTLISLEFLVFYSMWVAWDGGWSWGPRFLIPVIPFIILPLGESIGRLIKKREFIVLVCAITAVSTGVQFLGVSVNHASYLEYAHETFGQEYYDVVRWEAEHSPVLGHINILATFLRGDTPSKDVTLVDVVTNSPKFSELTEEEQKGVKQYYKRTIPDYWFFILAYAGVSPLLIYASIIFLLATLLLSMTGLKKTLSSL